MLLIAIKALRRVRGNVRHSQTKPSVHMAKPFPVNPRHPERICWGCDRYCAASDLACGNGADRTMHPIETFGEGWHEQGDWGIEPVMGPDVQPGEMPR
ncbi:hypothetical protein thsps21_40690 [Pseudomonas sp. No.21]|nr:hypothetical protein TUM20249_35020 [Pseudomonas tohonis]